MAGQASKRDKKDAEPDLDIARVAAPAPGCSLEAFVAYREQTGGRALMSGHGNYAWISVGTSVMDRWPAECTEPPHPDELRALLRLPGIRFVNYLVPPDDLRPANCFDYVCRDPQYQIGSLTSHARRDVRRGLRRFEVRLCTRDELAEKGFAAHADTLARHGDEVVQNRVKRPSEEQKTFADIWGAWRDGELAAYMRVFRIDDWALIVSACSQTAVLKDCPNNAIAYAATRKYLVEDGLRFVSYGLSSLQDPAGDVTTYKYKVRMGYEALRMHRAFAVSPILGPMLRTRAGSWLLESAAGVFSGKASLKKLAGLSRLMSGRGEAPLAWAPSAGDGAES